MRRKTLVIVAILLAATVGVFANYGRIAVTLAPRKHPSSVRTEAALKADEVFWRTLHHGNYMGITDALDTLTAAYLQTPTDAVTAAHIGWLHIWRVSESARLNSVPPTITDQMTLARRYFQEAVTLDRSDARFLGFLAGTTLAEANIHKDEQLTRRGYFMLRDAIDAWPEFNLFTAGYALSRQPSDSPRFREGLEWQWRNLDECAEQRVDRVNPDFTKYMKQEIKKGPKRACWNSWIAPHNFEGFFLNMGDMLVKSGDWQTAQRIYANAKLSRDYANWAFRDVLEDRMRRAQDNVTVFSVPDGNPRIGIMIRTDFSCVACHQN
jgi:hypothetical protein